MNEGRVPKDHGSEGTSARTVRSGKSRWLKWTRRYVLFPLERGLAAKSLVGDAPFHDPSIFPWAADLEASWLSALREIECVLEEDSAIPRFGDIVTADAKLVAKTDWQALFLFSYGMRVDRNCERFPETMRLLDDVPGVKTAFFSVLNAGNEIPMHRGPYKGVLRYHLGLVVPDFPTEVGIEVGGIQANWEPGKSLVFDDAYPHRAWNRSKERRIVLFLDIARPLPQPYRALNEFIIWIVGRTSYIRQARANQEEWDRRQLEKARSSA